MYVSGEFIFFLSMIEVNAIFRWRGEILFICNRHVATTPMQHVSYWLVTADGRNDPARICNATYLAPQVGALIAGASVIFKQQDESMLDGKRPVADKRTVGVGQCHINRLLDLFRHPSFSPPNRLHQ